MKKVALIPLSALLYAFPFSIHAQAASDSEQSAVKIEHGMLREGTEVHLKMLETVASNTYKRGDRFGMEVAEPVIVDGREWIPVGSPAVGEVIDAAKPGAGGKAGRLILATRFVVTKDVQITLHSFTAGA